MAEATSLAIVIFDQGVDLDVMAALAEMGIQHYTKFEDVIGSGRTGPRAGNPIWPGLNTVLLLHLADEQIPPLVQRLHEIRDAFPITPAMRVIVTPAQLL